VHVYTRRGAWHPHKRHDGPQAWSGPPCPLRCGRSLFHRHHVSRMWRRPSCESAEPAAVFDERLVRPSRKTFDAADADEARADVLRLLGMWSLPSRAGGYRPGSWRPGLKLRLESHPRLLVASSGRGIRVLSRESGVPWLTKAELSELRLFLFEAPRYHLSRADAHNLHSL
jgi:hypothetical protein